MNHSHQQQFHGHHQTNEGTNKLKRKSPDNGGSNCELNTSKASVGGGGGANGGELDYSAPPSKKNILTNQNMSSLYLASPNSQSGAHLHSQLSASMLGQSSLPLSIMSSLPPLPHHLTQPSQASVAGLSLPSSAGSSTSAPSPLSSNLPYPLSISASSLNHHQQQQQQAFQNQYKSILNSASQMAAGLAPSASPVYNHQYHPQQASSHMINSSASSLNLNQQYLSNNSPGHQICNLLNVATPNSLQQSAASSSNKSTLLQQTQSQNENSQSANKTQLGFDHPHDKGTNFTNCN